ncbi:putative ribonuclease H-like domain-containing protein [Tanacetum coccineum]|uniref:Ribonuclease H-like domain-containing protein n=1 Tax=Tanacetum coccineum TaxID=301880 RepID=A0ABQ5A5C3_9ASTR
MHNLEEIVYSNDDEEVGAKADMNNLATTVPKVWTLVDLPYGKRAIGTKWVHRNKKDDRGIVVRNKARLVAQGCTQEEGINYDEVFAPVARIEAIRLFLAYASFMNFIVYQMDVKSAFLYGTIEEELYVCQPSGFEDQEFPNKVYKVEKALYGLHQALRAWYETLSTYLLENGFRRGTIDKTLFIKKDKSDILLVQVYVDDIIFGSTKKSLCTEFEQMLHKRFQMSSIGELTFFLGLQTTSTPIETNKALLKDEEAADVDVHLYRSMIGSLMYLTASRPDIMFVVYACARFQVTPKTSHLHAVERIFRYLKGHPKLGLWYSRDSPFDLEAFSNCDYASASLDRKSTTGGCQFLRRRLISWQCKKQTIVANSTTKAEYVVVANYCGQVLWIQNQLLDYGYNFMNTKIFIDNESTIYETVIKEWEDRMERAVTTASSLQVEQDSVLWKYALTVNPTVYESCIKQFWATAKAKTVNGDRQIQALVDKKKVIITKKSLLLLDSIHAHYSQPSSSKPQKKKSRRKQRKDSGPTEPIPDEATNEEPISTPSCDLPQSAKTAQAKEIASLKKRVKQLEKRRKSRTSGLKRLRKVGSASRVESSNDVSLGVRSCILKGRKIVDLDVDEEFRAMMTYYVSEVVTTTSATTTIDELTLAQTLIEIKAAKPKAVKTAATTITTDVASIDTKK